MPAAQQPQASEVRNQVVCGSCKAFNPAHYHTRQVRDGAKGAGKANGFAGRSSPFGPGPAAAHAAQDSSSPFLGPAMDWGSFRPTQGGPSTRHPEQHLFEMSHVCRRDGNTDLADNLVASYELARQIRHDAMQHEEKLASLQASRRAKLNKRSERKRQIEQLATDFEEAEKEVQLCTDRTRAIQLDLEQVLTELDELDISIQELQIVVDAGPPIAPPPASEFQGVRSLLSHMDSCGLNTEQLTSKILDQCEVLEKKHRHLVQLGTSAGASGSASGSNFFAPGDPNRMSVDGGPKTRSLSKPGTGGDNKIPKQC